MSFLNFYLGRIAYSDASPVQNPRQKNFDLSVSKEGLHVSYPSSCIKHVAPGETVLIDSTTRTIGADLSTTEFELAFVENSDLARLKWTGTGVSPGFRAYRSVDYGDTPSTTVYQSVRQSPTAVQVTLTGVGVDLSAVQVGDEMRLAASEGSFSSPLNATGTGRSYLVLGSTATSVTVRDAGTIAEETQTIGVDYETVIRFFSSDGVQVGDKMSFADSSAFNLENKSGNFEVQSVTDREIVFYNPNLIPETVVAGVVAPLSFYNRLINFVSIEATGPIQISFDGGNSFVQLQEFENNRAVLMSTIRATSISAKNDTNYEISVSLQSCTF